MLSFLRARPTQTPPLREMRWDGRALDLLLDPALAGERVALDLDGCFFSDAPVGADGRAQFAFPFAPKAGASSRIALRRGRDGALLAPESATIRFGQSGIGADDAAASVIDDLGTIGAIVPFGVDCAARDVAIVVPVYDAPTLVERCLDSVIAHTTGRAHLIIIDDASPDPAIAPLLARYVRHSSVRVLRNERNRGFTATANRGIVEAGRADVVLLNADTEVGPNWLTGLRRAAASASDVATVTAVSDNAGAFSVPELEHENPMPTAWTFEQTARALWQSAGCAYPALPTGNGFCMYVRRAVFDAVGIFDEGAFPQGYGEENDFCQRASARGLRHLIAGNVYVRHARSASFGHERRAALGATGMAVLRERWPNYESDVAATLHSFERRVLDWRVRRVFATSGTGTPRPRILRTGDSAAKPADGWRLVANGDDVELWHGDRVVASHAPHRGGADANATSLDEHLWHWLQAYAIDAVIAVSDGFAPSLPRLAAALGIPFSSGSGAEPALSDAIAAARSFVEPAR